MNILYAILLGIMQGATEFLPISSSGHLALAHAFWGVKEASLAFDVALHLGTLVSIVIYFRQDLLMMAKALIFFRDREGEMCQLRQLALFICLATVPGVLAGLLLGDISENYLRGPAIVAAVLASVGLLLLLAEKVGAHNRHFSTISLKDAMIIGLSQALAIVPGVSRSGITMTAGLFRGLNREAVARFSFLLSAPIVFGAGVYKIPEIISQGLAGGQAGAYLAGFLSAAVSGYLVIAFLLRFIKTRSFEIFAYYRLLIAGLVYATVFIL